MGKKIKFNNKVKTNTMLADCTENNGLTYAKFVELHGLFIKDKELEGLAPRTLEEHVNNFRYFQVYFNSTQSDENCVVDLVLFKSYIYYMLEEKKYSKYTVNIRLRTIKCYLRWLFNNEYIKENIAIKIKLVKVPIDTCKTLSNKEIKQILNSINVSEYHGFRDFTSIILILDTGIRVGELVQLKIADVDLKERLITVRAEVSKTRNVRFLPISPKTCKLMKELIDCSIENQTDYIFQSSYGGQIKKNNLILSFRKIGVKSGINKRFTPYVLRHTFATNAVKSGIMDMFTLQRIMGHSTLLTTRKYVQLETEDLKAKHKKASPIDQILKGGRR